MAGPQTAFMGRVEIRAPLKTPAWEARWPLTRNIKQKNLSNICRLKSVRGRLRVTNVIQSPKKGFDPCPIAITFSPLTGIEVCQNAVVSKIDITMTTIKKKL